MAGAVASRCLFAADWKFEFLSCSGCSWQMARRSSDLDPSPLPLQQHSTASPPPVYAPLGPSVVCGARMPCLPQPCRQAALPRSGRILEGAIPCRGAWWGKYEELVIHNASFPRLDTVTLATPSGMPTCFAGAVPLGANRGGRGTGPMFGRPVSKSASTTALAMERDA